MTAIRVAFLCAWMLLLAGIFEGRALVAPLFASGNAKPSMTISARGHSHGTAVVLVAAVTATPTRGRSSPRSGRLHVTQLHRNPPVQHPTVTIRRVLRTATPTATPRPSATPRPTATPLSGIVTLDRYWISSTVARRGHTLAIGYIIDNGTGRKVRLLLGASIKPTRVYSWARSYGDLPDEVAAIVAPGISTHIRYFALPLSLRPGAYDIAWGLRNASNRERIAIAVAADSLLLR